MRTQVDELELVKLVAAGNELAFRKLYLLYHKLLRSHVYRLTESMDLADEIVQDVFLKIWTNREALEGINSFKAYLLIVSRNYTIDQLRKHIRKTILHQKWETEEVKSLEAEGNDDSSNIHYGLLDEAIDQLPPQQKRAYILSRHEHLKYAEIAEQMGISKETVKKYLQHAVASISVYVKRHIELVAFIIYFFTKK